MTMTEQYKRLAAEQDVLWTLLHAARQHCQETGDKVEIEIDAARVRVHVTNQHGYSVAYAKEREDVYGDVAKELIDTLERAASEVQR